MWPTSTVLTTASGAAQCGHWSPAATWRRSRISAWKSSPKVTWRRWVSSLLAPAIRLRRPTSARSARMAMFFTPTGPSEPASAPNHSTISSGRACRNSGALATAPNLVSLRWCSPRRSASAGLPSAPGPRLFIWEVSGKPVKAAHLGDGLPAGRVEFLRREIAFGIGQGGRGRRGDGLFQVRRVPAGRAHGHKILARAGNHHELVRLAAAHGAGMRLHGGVRQAAAVEDTAVGLEVLLVGGVQPGLIHVEGVGILHDELARPKRSLSWNMLSPMMSQRPDSCQISAGFSAGRYISWAPMAPISSLTIRWILSSDRWARNR